MMNANRVRQKMEAIRKGELNDAEIDELGEALAARTAGGIRTLYERLGDCRYLIRTPYAVAHAKARSRTPRSGQACDTGISDAELAGYPIDNHLIQLIEKCPEFARGLRQGVTEALAAPNTSRP